MLGGYVEYVRRMHPGAPIPAVHRTDALLDQSRHLREQIGDEKFIAGLPGGGEDDEWGEDRFWTGDLLDAAFAATYDDELRRRLVSDLLGSWQRGFFSNALEDAEGFVSLDRGLTEISRHARELRYDGLILFLDELILWLANSIGDQQFRHGRRPPATLPPRGQRESPGRAEVQRGAAEATRRGDARCAIGGPAARSLGAGRASTLRVRLTACRARRSTLKPPPQRRPLGQPRRYSNVSCSPSVGAARAAGGPPMGGWRASLDLLPRSPYRSAAARTRAASSRWWSGPR